MSFYSRPQTLVQAITKQSWDPGKRKMPVDFGISTLGGLKFDLFEKPLSIFYTLSYKRDFSYSAGIYRRFNANTVYSDFLDTESWTFNENFTGLMNFSYRLNGNNKLNYNFLLVNKLFDNVYEQGRDGKGYKFDMDQISDSFFARDMNTRTTRLLVNQLLGEHNLSENNKLDWGVGFNLVGADEPNRIRTYTGFYNNELYFSYRISDFENRKSSQEINDKEINGKANSGRVQSGRKLTAAKHLLHHADQLQSAGITDAVIDTIRFLASNQHTLFTQNGKMLGNVALRSAHSINNLLNASFLVTKHTKNLQTQRV